MTNDELTKLKAICDAATPGPWCYSDGVMVIQTSHITRDVWTICEAHHHPKSDAAFIATFNPTKVKELLDEIERLNDKIRAPCSKCDSIYTQASKEIEALQVRVENFKRIADHEHIVACSFESKLEKAIELANIVMDDDSCYRQPCFYKAREFLSQLDDPNIGDNGLKLDGN